MRCLSQNNERAVSLRRNAAPRGLTLSRLLIVSLLSLAPATLMLGGIPARAAVHVEDTAGLEAAAKSKLIPLTLPAGALRSKDENDIAKFADALRKMAKPSKRDIREVEVLAWASGKDIKEALPRALKAIGYKYAAQSPFKAEGNKITVFATAAAGNKIPVLGMWVDHGDGLVLAWATLTAATEGKAAQSEKQNASTDSKESAEKAAGDNADASPAKSENNPEPVGELSRKATPDRAAASDGNALVIQSDASTLCLNVMGRKMPALPAMPKVEPKPGFVRGYVRDTQGHPLKGALIGVRSTAVGGFYSGASSKTDAQGYYEIKAPWGAGSFYCAGYTADYGDLIAAFGLHPADGATDEFATANGVVKNWVLLPYGIGDRAKAQDDPKWCGNYYGGTIVFYYYTDGGSQNKSALPANSQIEITLTPDGPLLDGSKGRTIVVHREAGNGFSCTFYLNNIPVGAYKIKARATGVGELRLRETGPYANRAFGMTPKTVTGEANLLLKVYGADPNSALASHGHWNTFQIDLERP